MIHFQNKSKEQLRTYYPLMRKILTRILLDNDLNPGVHQITILFSTDTEITQLNFAYRQINGPTDVLAFPANEVEPETGLRYLGDIVISMNQVKKQQELFLDEKVSILILLVIHGTLHLLGYDHGTRVEKEKMWRQQSRYLSEYNISVQIQD